MIIKHIILSNSYHIDISNILGILIYYSYSSRISWDVLLQGISHGRLLQRPTVAERSDWFYFPCAEPSACAELSTLLIYVDFNTHF